MAPHDYRRLLLAHRDAGPVSFPAPHAAEPSGMPRAGDAPTPPPGSRVASLAEPAEQGGPPSVRAAR